jgi:hypothetical protein
LQEGEKRRSPVKRKIKRMIKSQSDVILNAGSFAGKIYLEK